MRALLTRVVVWLRRVVGSVGERGRTHPAHKLGAQTARFLRTIGPSLTSAELGSIITLGESEWVLQELRASLRNVYLDMAAVDRDAIAMKERVDAFLSEPGGILARTLAPIRNQAPSESKRSIERALDTSAWLVTEARSVLDTADTLTAAKARLDGACARHGDLLPETLERMLQGTKASDRVQKISTPVSARRLLAEVIDIEQSIDRQRACYEHLALQLEHSAAAVGLEPQAVRSKTRGLEEYTRELTSMLDAACADRHGAAFKRTLRTARGHKKRLQHDNRFAHSKEGVAGLPSHAAINEWKALHAMHPRPIAREDSE